MPRTILDDCYRINIRLLWKTGLLNPGTHSDHLSLAATVRLPFTTCLSPDHGCWIELVGFGRWEIVLQPIRKSSPAWFVVGNTDKRRVEYLLVEKDLSRAGTRWDLRAVWRSQWMQADKRRVQIRAKLIRRIGAIARPDDLSLIFSPYVKPKGRKVTSDRDGCKDILVKKPPRMHTRTFHWILNRLNRTRGASPSPPFKPLPLYPRRSGKISSETQALLQKLADHRFE